MPIPTHYMSLSIFKGLESELQVVSQLEGRVQLPLMQSMEWILRVLQRQCIQLQGQGQPGAKTNDLLYMIWMQLYVTRNQIIYGYYRARVENQSNLACNHRQRKVPWCNCPNNPDWLQENISYQYNYYLERQCLDAQPYCS